MKVNSVPKAREDNHERLFDQDCFTVSYGFVPNETIGQQLNDFGMTWCGQYLSKINDFNVCNVVVSIICFLKDVDVTRNVDGDGVAVAESRNGRKSNNERHEINQAILLFMHEKRAKKTPLTASAT